MTDTPTREPLVGLAERLREVTQEDREAAVGVIGAVLGPEGRAEVLAGRRDSLSVVRAFAQHRATALEEQSRRVEELTVALRPFALAADDLDDKHRDGSPIWEAPAAMSIDAGHLRAARTALSPSDTVK